MRAACRAFDEGPWPRMTARERKLALAPLGDLLRAYEQEFASCSRWTTGCSSA